MRLKVFAETWQEARTAAARWALLLALVTGILILAHPFFSGLGRAGWPVWVAAFFPREAILDPVIWAWQVVMGWVLPLLVAVYAARLGSWLMAGEEERGTLGFLLAAPVPRYRLVFEKALVLAAALLGIIALIWAVFLLATWIKVGPISLVRLLRGALALLLFGLTVGGLALALGCLTGRRRISQNVTLLAVLITLAVGHLPESLPVQQMHWISPFYHYSAVLRGGGVGIALLLLLVIAVFLTAWLGFERRDLPI